MGRKRIVSEEWIDRVTTPHAIEASYGYLFWLNTDRQRWPSAPGSAFAARGHGANTIWIDPDRGLVVVLRWIESNAADGDRGNDGFYTVCRKSLCNRGWIMHENFSLTVYHRLIESLNSFSD